MSNRMLQLAFRETRHECVREISSKSAYPKHSNQEMNVVLGMTDVPAVHHAVLKG